MSSFDKSQTRKKTKRKTKAAAKKMTMMPTKTTATRRERSLICFRVAPGSIKWLTTTSNAPHPWKLLRFRVGSSPSRNSSRPTHCEYSRHRDRRSRYPARLIGLISVANGIVQCGERFELVSVARNQLALAMLYSNQRPEAVPLDLEEPIGTAERSGSATERHRLEMQEGH